MERITGFLIMDIDFIICYNDTFLNFFKYNEENKSIDKIEDMEFECCGIVTELKMNYSMNSLIVNT